MTDYDLVIRGSRVITGTGEAACRVGVRDGGRRLGLSQSGRLASWKVMSKSSSRRFPVTVSQLPVMRCQICHRTVAYQPGKASEVLTEHYRRTHPEMLGRTPA